ncbi:MAG: acyl-CoA dehydratase activase [Firmicutes bacterium]|nr:acyl-CoA dehydratase activase [Bacillota bacterium]
MEVFLGIDVGSVSTKMTAIDRQKRVVTSTYMMTMGQPVKMIREGLRRIRAELPEGVRVSGVGTTGSGRQLAGVLVGADSVKNEITAHAVAALELVPAVQTILEIGGQDSKIILLNNGVVVDFAMNTVCAAGTGSFLDRQAARLNIPIESFGALALESRNPVRIAGRCAVFAESDMIHKQQMGHETKDIVRGLCQALVRNFLNNVAKGKDIRPPVLFQGGVASNVGMKRAFEEALGFEVTIPEQHRVMGAVGAALLAMEAALKTKTTNFRGFGVADLDFSTRTFECHDCANNCEIVEISMEKTLVARWGSRCGKWDYVEPREDRAAGGD